MAYDPRKIQAIKNIVKTVEDGRSLRQAIRDAGFSQSTADHPKRITDSKWFKAALTDYEDEANIVRDLKHSARLDHYVFPLSMKDEEIVELIEGIPGCKVRKIKHGETQTWAYFWTPDNKSRNDILDKIWKLRGDYAPVKTQEVNPLEGMTNEQLKEYEDNLERIMEGRGLNSG